MAHLRFIPNPAAGCCCEGKGIGLWCGDFAEPEEAGCTQFRCVLSAALMCSSHVLCTPYPLAFGVSCCVQSSVRQTSRFYLTRSPATRTRTSRSSSWRPVAEACCPVPRLRPLLRVHTLHRMRIHRARFRPPGGCCPASLCRMVLQPLAWLCLPSSHSNERAFGMRLSVRAARASAPQLCG